MSFIASFIAAIKANPVRAVAIIRSIILVGLSFGLPLTGDQQTAILGLAGILLLSDEVVRSQVTPVSDPKLPVGAPVTTPSGADAVVVPATPAAVAGAVPEVDGPDQ